MNVVGIDISRGKSTVAVLRPFGEVVMFPFEVKHSNAELLALSEQLKSIDGETRVTMEHTGRYYEPVANALHNSGLFVSTVNPLLIKGYGGNSLRKVKTDKTDAQRIARYLPPYSSACHRHRYGCAVPSGQSPSGLSVARQQKEGKGCAVLFCFQCSQRPFFCPLLYYSTVLLGLSQLFSDFLKNFSFSII